MNLVNNFKSNKSDPIYKVSLNTVHDEYIAPTKKTTPPRATFQRAMKLTVLIGQCFGLSPVLGICETDAGKLRFTICSGRCLYSLLSIVAQILVLGLCIIHIFKVDANVHFLSNTSIVFFGTNCITTMLFLRIAMKWPKLCQHIFRIEAADPNVDNSLVRRCNISCIVILSLSAVEHILSDVNGIAIAIDCQPDKNLYEAFTTQSFPWIWRFFPYNPVLGFFALIVNFQCTFNWNYSDTFVICISWYLIARLQQVNKRVVDVKGQVVPASFWRTIREDYCRATSLVRRVDEVISGVIFISFANNLFFICVQLLNILEKGIEAPPICHSNLDIRPFHGHEHAVYFLYSLIFLILRSLAVSLVTAQVHSASLEPAKALYDVPSASYCVEVQRFLDQIHGDTVALTGLQFFHIKRGLILTIAGTIVTYELVLMQFTGISPTTTPPTGFSQPVIPVSTTPQP